MMRLLIVIPMLFYFSVQAQTGRQTNIEIKNGIAYERGVTEPFSGEHISYYYLEDVKEKGHYVNGLKEGVFEYYSMDRFPSIFYDRKVNMLDSTVQYHQGKRNGSKYVYQHVFKQDRLRASEQFENDLLAGTSLYWNNAGLLTARVTYKQGKQMARLNYLPDPTIDRLDYRIRECPKDTIDANRFHQGDTLTIEVVARTKDGQTISLSGKKYTVISYRIVRADAEQTSKGEKVVLFALNDFFNVKNYVPHIYITNVRLRDPQGAEYRLPDKKIVVRDKK